MDSPTTTHGKHEAAAHKHFGKIINFADGILVTQSDVCGRQTYRLAPDSCVLRDGKPGHTNDLRPDTIVRVTTRKDDESMAIEIECMRCP
jgi:hypothetical protein